LAHPPGLSLAESRNDRTQHPTRLRPVPTPEDSLRAAVRRYEREKATLDKRAEKNSAKRDAAIRNAYAAGLSMREIAKLANVSHQRVGQVIKRRV
jgi:DNA-directed RNA polymerase specialized sigma24 family protein